LACILGVRILVEAETFLHPEREESVSSFFVRDEILSEGESNRLSEVTVFMGEAYLKRKIRCEAEEGLHRFLIETQAVDVDSDSVQAAVRGNGEIQSVQYKEIPLREAPQEEVEELEETLRGLKREKRALEDEKSRLSKKKTFLDSVMLFAEADVPKKLKTALPSVEELKSMVSFLDEGFKEALQGIRDLDQKIEEMDKDISVVERKLKRHRKPKDRKRKCIEVVFRSSERQKIEIEASYVARNASWSAVYKVDVPLDRSRVQLTQFAQIEQKTGEPWNGVKLSVSNAIPMRGASLPDLETWKVTIPPEMPYAGGAVAAQAMTRRKRGKTVELAAMEGDLMEGMLAEEALAPEAEFVEAQEKSLPHAFEYEFAQAVDLESGGDEAILPLYTKELEGEFFHFAVPKVDPLVYSVCKTSPDQALLAGTLNIYFAGRFVGSARLDERKAGEELLINLGADRGVKADRRKVTDKLTESFFGKVERFTVARELEFLTVLENTKEEEILVRLLEAIPVSETDFVQVKGVATSPKPQEEAYQKREGVMLWEFRVSPKDTREISVRFAIKHPKDRPPLGL